MKFKQYLNEKELSIDEIISLIKRDCQPFLKDLHSKYKNNYIYSGRHDTKLFAKKIVRKNRNPKDTPLEIHKFADDWFYKKFHIRARSNTLFCSFNEFTADEYGTTFIIFPIGKYKFITGNTHDLLDIIRENLNIIKKNKKDISINEKNVLDGMPNDDRNMWNDMTDDEKKQFFKLFEKSLKEINYGINKYSMDNEIMLSCKEYYIVRNSFYERTFTDKKIFN